MVDTVRKINPESFGFLLFMILELFTSEFLYFGMKVDPKKWFSFAVVSISKTTSFKTDRTLNFLRKRSQNFISLLLSRLLHIYIYIYKTILWVIRKDLSWVVKSQELDLRNYLF